MLTHNPTTHFMGYQENSDSSNIKFFHLKQTYLRYSLQYDRWTVRKAMAHQHFVLLQNTSYRTVGWTKLLLRLRLSSDCWEPGAKDGAPPPVCDELYFCLGEVLSFSCFFDSLLLHFFVVFWKNTLYASVLWRKRGGGKPKVSRRSRHSTYCDT